ncbi:hypothetical protein MD484_g7300, partial [Candolleomyces efflorescens]
MSLNQQMNPVPPADFVSELTLPKAFLKNLQDIPSGVSSPLTPLTDSTPSSTTLLTQGELPIPDSVPVGLNIVIPGPVADRSFTSAITDGILDSAFQTSGDPQPQHPAPAVLIPPPSPASSDSSSSDDNNCSSFTIRSRLTMADDKVYCTLTVTEGNTKPPTLGKGRLGRDVGVEFKDACEAYFVTKEIADDKKVIKVINSFQDFKHKQWIKLNRVELLKKTWEDFIDEFLTRWTEKHWDMNLSDRLRNLVQGSAHFYEWAQDYRAQAAHLVGTPYEMDEKTVRNQISALMDPRLCLRTKANAKFTAIADFDNWLDAINDEYELYTADLSAAVKLLKAQQDSHINKRQKTSHHTTAPPATSSSTGLADANTNTPRRFCPGLTNEERNLLKLNAGCFNCRKFFVNHRRDTCTDFPPAANYKTLTQADADAARAKMDAAKAGATGKGKQVAAASITEVDNADASTVEAHTVAATLGRMVKYDAEGEGYRSEDSYVSPVSCPTLPWSALAFGQDEFPTTVSCLLDCGSQLILISEPCRARLGLGLRSLPKPFRLELALPASNAPSATPPPVFRHFVRLSLSTLNNAWSSRTFNAVVAPSLVENKDFILGTPFLCSNKLVLDFDNMTATPKSSNIDLLNLREDACSAPVPMPNPDRISLTTREQRSLTRNLSLAMRELRSELRKVPRPEDRVRLAPACGFPHDNMVFRASGSAYAIGLRDIEDEWVMVNRFELEEEDFPQEPVVSDDSSPWLGPATGATIASLIDRIKAGLFDFSREDIDKFIREEYGDVFGAIPPVSELPTDDLCHIPLIDATKCIESRSYASPRKYRDAWATIINDHLTAGQIRPSDSHHASPSFLIPKADPTALPRWVIDYRQLNRNVRLDWTPLPRVDDILADAAKGRYWAKFDMTNSFFQTRMHPDDVPLTATSTPLGLFEWTVMPMGFKNSPQIHQRRMRRALAKYIGKFCHVYLDDIIVWLSSLQEHVQNLRRILSAIRSHKLFLNAKKSVFCATEISFLGHVIGRDGIRPDGSKVDRIHRWPVPQSAKDVRRFLGLVRYLDPFLPQLAQHAEVLNKLTHKECNDVFPPWLPHHQRAFEAIKALVTSADCLTTIDHRNPGDNKIYVTCDASEIGTGAVLSFGPTWESARPVAFYSKSLKDAERHYPTHEKEMLAIVWALHKWRADLIGTPFFIYTDHRTLEYFDTQRDLSSRQLRWNEFLSEYEGRIVYIRGKDNVVADALSWVEFVTDLSTADTAATLLLDNSGSSTRVCMLVDRTTQYHSAVCLALTSSPAVTTTPPPRAMCLRPG